jgi:hypothetical protein
MRQLSRANVSLAPVVTGAITTVVTAAGMLGWHASADTISVSPV